MCVSAVGPAHLWSADEPQAELAGLNRFPRALMLLMLAATFVWAREFRLLPRLEFTPAPMRLALSSRFERRDLSVCKSLQAELSSLTGCREKSAA